MTRKEFMRQLEYLLQDIPDEEREEAVAYYRDYLEEAGDEGEEEALKEFGSPERVAAIIRSDLNGNLEDGGSFTESGYEDERFRDPNTQMTEHKDLPDAIDVEWTEHQDEKKISGGADAYENSRFHDFQISMKKRKVTRRIRSLRKSGENGFEGWNYHCDSCSSLTACDWNGKCFYEYCACQRSVCGGNSDRSRSSDHHRLCRRSDLLCMGNRDQFYPYWSRNSGDWSRTFVTGSWTDRFCDFMVALSAFYAVVHQRNCKLDQ